jgi:DNA-binding XRE family transcriptional regulator
MLLLVVRKQKKPAKPGRPRISENGLARWLDEQQLTRAQAAEKLGITEAALNYVCNGSRLPGLKLAFDIEHLTRGVITAKSWLRAPKPKPQKKA